MRPILRARNPSNAIVKLDSNGVIYDPDGIDREKLAFVIELKNVKRGRIRDYADHYKKAIFMPTTSSWSNPVNGANSAGFQKVANAMLDQGLV